MMALQSLLPIKEGSSASPSTAGGNGARPANSGMRHGPDGSTPRVARRRLILMRDTAGKAFVWLADTMCEGLCPWIKRE